MGSEKILVVEDGSLVAMDMERQLNERGYKVIATVSNGKDAIQKAIKHKPDLILMDIMLEGEMDGIEAADEILRQIDIPIIYLTAYADEEILNRAKATCPCGYLIKPYAEENLHATIQMTLSRFARESNRLKSARWLSAGLNTIDDGLIMTDMKHCVTFMNKSAKMMAGVESEMIIGRDVSDILVLTNSGGEKAIEVPSISAVNADTIIETGLCDMHNRGKRIITPVSIAATPVKSDDRLLVGAVMILKQAGKHRDVISQEIDSGIHWFGNNTPPFPELELRQKVHLENRKSSNTADISDELLDAYGTECGNYLLLFSDALVQKNGRAFEYLSEHFLSAMRRLKTSCARSVQFQSPDKSSGQELAQRCTDNLKKQVTDVVSQLKYYHRYRTGILADIENGTIYDWSATVYHLNLINNSSMPLSEIIKLFLKDTPVLIENLITALHGALDDKKLLQCYSLTGAADTMDAFTLRGFAILATVSSLLECREETTYLLEELKKAFIELKNIFAGYV